MNRTFFIAFAFAALFGSLAAEETSETDPLLRLGLERFPAADADGDGVLTRFEAEAFQAARKASRPPRPAEKSPEVRRYTAKELAERFEAREFKGVPYRFLEPPAFDRNSDRVYPLILSLHGAGGKGGDNLKNLVHWNGILSEPDFQQAHPCFVLVPQTDLPWRVAGPAPDLSEEAINSFPEIWRETIRDRKGLISEFDQGDLGTVFELLDSLAETYAIDPDRVYVLGHSMGGYGSWEAIAVAPERFAAAIPTAGGLAPWHDVRDITGIPIWCFHGDKDSTVPVAYSRIAFDQLSAVGGNVKYTECPGVGHGVNAYAFEYKGDEAAGDGFVTKYSSGQCDRTPDIWSWLFAQSRESETTNGHE